MGALCVHRDLHAQSAPPLDPGTLSLTLNVTNSATESIEAITRANSDKLDLGSAYRIKKPDSLRPFEPGMQQSPFVRTPVPVVRSKKVTEMLQRQKEWVFLEPTEQEFGLTAETFFNLPDTGREKSDEDKRSPLEKFYRRSASKDDGQTNRSYLANGDADDRDEKNPYKLDNLWAGSSVDSSGGDPLRPNPNGLASTFLQSLSSSPGVSLGSFNPDKYQSKTDDDRAKAQQTRMNDFQRMLDANFSVSADAKPADPGPWYTSSDPWNYGSGRSSLPEAQAPTAVGAAFDPLASPSSRNIATPGSPQLSTPSGYSSLTPATPAADDIRLKMPQPVFQMPKRQF
jgi:hypothetical protein